MADRVSVFYLGEQPTTLIDERQKIHLFQSGSVPLAQATQERTSTAHALLGCDAMRSMICPIAFGVQPVTYTAYGYNINSPAIAQGFSGQLRNLLQNAYLLGNGVRVLSTTLMRFYSPDFLYSPFGAGDINAYAYCGCDPINNSDVSGHVAVGQQPNRSTLTLKWISKRPRFRSLANRNINFVGDRPSSGPRGSVQHENISHFNQFTSGHIQTPHQPLSPNTSRAVTPRPASPLSTADTRPVVQSSQPAPQPNSEPQAYVTRNRGGRKAKQISAATANAISKMIDKSIESWFELDLDQTKAVQRKMITARQSGLSVSSIYDEHELTTYQRRLATNWLSKAAANKKQE